jgi:hypothetical protein
MNKELIELITDTVSKRAEVETATIYNACEARGFIRGTYTSYISMMKKAGYLRRVKHQVYAIGRPASAQTIALNLQRLILHKKGVPPKMPRNAPKQVDPGNLLQPVTTEPTESIESMEAIRGRRVGEAIEVLKSYGIKITLEF